MNKIFRPNFPFYPARFPFFYGWWILLVSTIGIICSIPGQTIGVGVFTDHLIMVSGLTRLELSVAYLVGTIGSSLLIPYGGILLDRLGARIMITTSGLGLGLALVLLSSSELLVGLAQSVLFFLPVSLRAILTMSFIFLLMRQFGQGLMTMVSRTVLSQWFDKKRGLVSGINGVVTSFGFSTAPLFLHALILQFGEVDTMLLLALTCGLGMALLGGLFFRDQPEECGLKMDGLEESHEHYLSNSGTTSLDVTLEEARKSYTFWIFSLGLALSALLVTGMNFHISSIGELAGMHKSEVYQIFFPIALISVITHFISGWLSDRIPLKYLLMVLVLALGVGTIGILNLANVWYRWLLIFGYGIQGGIWGCLSMVTWPRFYGRKHLGAISGLFMGVMVFFSAIGPAVFGLSIDLLGNYDGSVYIAIILSFLLFLAAFKAEQKIHLS